MKLRNFRGFIAAEDIDFADLCLFLCAGVVNKVIGLEDTGADLNQAVAADERVDNCFEDERTLRLRKIEVCLENLVGLHVDAGHLSCIGTRHVFHDIVEQCVDTLALGAGTALDRDNGAVLDIHTDCRADFRL